MCLRSLLCNVNRHSYRPFRVLLVSIFCSSWTGIERTVGDQERDEFWLVCVPVKYWQRPRYDEGKVVRLFSYEFLVALPPSDLIRSGSSDLKKLKCGRKLGRFDGFLFAG